MREVAVAACGAVGASSGEVHEVARLAAPVAVALGAPGPEHLQARDRRALALHQGGNQVGDVGGAASSAKGFHELHIRAVRLIRLIVAVNRLLLGMLRCDAPRLSRDVFHGAREPLSLVMRLVQTFGRVPPFSAAVHHLGWHRHGLATNLTAAVAGVEVLDGRGRIEEDGGAGFGRLRKDLGAVCRAAACPTGMDEVDPGPGRADFGRPVLGAVAAVDAALSVAGAAALSAASTPNDVVAARLVESLVQRLGSHDDKARPHHGFRTRACVRAGLRKP
mmetsp:Transcript_87543/g.252448  ORF Transcript_87543/g.252448 Transcript_87543/m.252448 type:complete len:277 (-) Transcript_87543:23-853(-)